MKDWLIVRVISNDSLLGRHFVEDKHRYCVLEDKVLSLRTSTTSTSSVGEYSLRY